MRRSRPANLPLAPVLARDVMTQPVLSVRENRTVREAAAFLTENDISGVPVLSRAGKLVGVVTLTDLAKEEHGRRVRDVMTPVVYTIPEETPVEKIARTMIAGRIHRLFVTRGGSVVGVVTTLDLLKLLTGRRPIKPLPRGAGRRFPSVDTARIRRLGRPDEPRTRPPGGPKGGTV